MKSSTRVVQGKSFHKPSSSGAKAAAAEAAAAENKLAVARAAAEKIAAAKQLNYQAPLEKDATSLTAEAIMKGHEATPVQLSVYFFYFFIYRIGKYLKVIKLFYYKN